MMDDHDKILCERLATTIDHGICKCHERHRIAALEERMTKLDPDRVILALDKLRTRITALEVALALRTRERDEWENRAGIYMSERDAERERRKAAEAALQAGRDVMAVIHGDGGHYREAHGDRKAADDAINIVTKLRVDLDEEHSRRKAAEAILRNQLDYGYFRENVHAYFARYKEE